MRLIESWNASAEGTCLVLNQQFYNHMVCIGIQQCIARTPCDYPRYAPPPPPPTHTPLSHRRPLGRGRYQPVGRQDGGLFSVRFRLTGLKQTAHRRNASTLHCTLSLLSPPPLSPSLLQAVAIFPRRRPVPGCARRRTLASLSSRFAAHGNCRPCRQGAGGRMRGRLRAMWADNMPRSSDQVTMVTQGKGNVGYQGMELVGGPVSLVAAVRAGRRVRLADGPWALVERAKRCAVSSRA